MSALGLMLFFGFLAIECLMLRRRVKKLESALLNHLIKHYPPIPPEFDFDDWFDTTKTRVGNHGQND